MAFSGLDIGVIQDTSRNLLNESLNLGGQMVQLDGLISRATSAWNGADSNAFAQTWQSSQRSQMMSAINLLSDMAKSLARNADEQARASAATAGSASTVSSNQNPPTPSSDDSGSPFDDFYDFFGAFLSLFNLDFITGTVQVLDDRTRKQTEISMLDLFGVALNGIGSVAKWADVASCLPALAFLEELSIPGLLIGSFTGAFSAGAEFANGKYVDGTADLESTVLLSIGGALMVTGVGIAPGMALVAAGAIIKGCKILYDKCPAVTSFVDNTIKYEENRVKTEVNDIVNSAENAWKILTSWF